MNSTQDLRQRTRKLLAKCQGDYDRFNSVFLGRPRYWHRQREVCRSVAEVPETWVPAGNAVGKGYVDAGILLGFLLNHPGCMVVATAPSQTQLAEVLWKEVERAHRGARIPIGGRLLKSPLKIDFGGGWQALAYSTSNTERFSGHHAAELLAIIDEASGVAPEIWEAIDSLNPSRKLGTGNPIRPDGHFFERCQRAEHNPRARLIRIPSTESPDIHLERSPRGMADKGWLEQSRNDYGEGSLWWLSHVDALFPGQAEDQVIPGGWLDLAALAIHKRSGPRRLAIDLAKGSGGDRTVLLVRDDNGILECQHSNTWNLEQAAAKAKLLCLKWKIEPHHVSWDVEGLGTDFNNRLEAEGIKGAMAYRGGNPGGPKFGNLRSAAAWMLRQRLDPKRRTPLGTVQEAFAIKPQFLLMARPELIGLRYSLDTKGRICLEAKDELVKRLKHSPDFADTLAQSFAFPNT